jgi:hypothetical protein
MKWCFAFALACIAVPWGALDAVPVPEKRPEMPERIDIAGTIWEGIDGPQGELGHTRYTFEPDGALSWTDKFGSFPKQGSWKLEGSVLYFETCKKYREFRGPIQGNVVSGESWNVAGARWPLTIKRAAAGK